MRRLIYFITVAMLLSCAGHEKSNLLVMDYRDFGPQVIAHEVIGMEWWQWLEHGESRPTEYPIKVVVYRQVPLEAVRKEYPVIESRKQDYRYLKYQDAIQYLDKKIEENLMEEVTQHLQQARLKIVNELGT